jgi:threonine/homoserine/homoserine lactone efflux protein
MPAAGWSWAALGLPDGQGWLLFVAATFVLNATPGVDLLLTVSRTLQGGTRAGVAAALGINAGCVVHALAAAFGLAAVLAVSATAFTVVRWLGAAYLLWLAVGLWRAAWRGAADSAGSLTTVPRRTAWQDFRTGLLTNLLNPKVALFFLAFLPQFIAAGSAHKTLAFLLLGTAFMVQSLIFLLLVVALTTTLAGLTAARRQRSRSRALTRMLQALGGTLFAGLAWRLTVGGRTAA